MKVYVAEDDDILREMLSSHLADFCSGMEDVAALGSRSRLRLLRNDKKEERLCACYVLSKLI